MCGCCDKKLGEGKMQSVSISSHCQSSSDPLVDTNISSFDVRCSMLVSVIYRICCVSFTDCDIISSLPPIMKDERFVEDGHGGGGQ